MTFLDGVLIGVIIGLIAGSAWTLKVQDIVERKLIPGKLKKNNAHKR